MVRTEDLTARELRALRELVDIAFDEFADEDWQHALGGVHVILDVDGHMRAHAAVVERRLCISGTTFRTGYVEAVAARPGLRGIGLGTSVMRAVGDYISDHFPLGALSTGAHHFYARLGWQTWQGRSSVRTQTGEQPTPDDDGTLMVLSHMLLDVAAPISCEWGQPRLREGAEALAADSGHSRLAARSGVEDSERAELDPTTRSIPVIGARPLYKQREL